MSDVLRRDPALLDRFAPVSLDELARDAALMTRTDRKYVLPATDLPAVVAALGRLDPDLRVLEIAGRTQHSYASTYLDTPELEAYWRAAQRRRRRFKVRTRQYVDTGLAFTEVKTRGPRGTTVKTRAPLSHTHDFVGAELHDAGLSHVDPTALVPTLRTGYRRSTLWLPSRQARVTIDTDLAWSLPTGTTRSLVPGLVVVETKTAGTGTGVDRTLWARGHRPVRISKYATGLALIRPDLPAHRWHRLLTQQLRPHTRHDQIQEIA